MSYLNPHSVAADLCVDITPLLRLAAARPDRPGPDFALAASQAQAAGADAIGLSLCGPDGESFAALLPMLMTGLQLPLALTIPATAAMVELVAGLQPQRICLVPAYSLNPTLQIDAIKAVVDQLQATPMSVSIALAIAATPEQLQAAFEAGVDAIELDATHYAAAGKTDQVGLELDHIATCAAAAVRLGLRVQVAHGLDASNLGALAALADIAQVQSGLALLSRAIFVGWQRAVGELKAALSQARSGRTGVSR
ncbi:pyridoxine 5'-phosphate synthase [Actimicrobium antarcticum]|uniref:Pyridoxine 5'-phosphate synthase n=1 Tax=Actimicrobium antarcticum TaxID=1051899 RepID=A0ABP7T008_9BURK